MKVKAHKKYRLKDGSIVVGVSTVCNMLSKPALIPWANKLGLNGIDVRKYVDELADIGTLAHLMIETDLKKGALNLDDYTPNQISKAQNAKKKFDAWLLENDFSLVASELELVSEKWRFGGCCDIYCVLNGKKTLIDLKTSRALYPEHLLQVSAYKKLLEENDHHVEDVRILRIGRDESEGFDDKKVPLTDLYWQKFTHLLSIYDIDKRLKSGVV